MHKMALLWLALKAVDRSMTSKKRSSKGDDILPTNECLCCKTGVAVVTGLGLGRWEKKVNSSKIRAECIERLF